MDSAYVKNTLPSECNYSLIGRYDTWCKAGVPFQNMRPGRHVYGRPLWTYRADCNAWLFLYNALQLIATRSN